LPARGVVSLEEGSRILAQAALNSVGQANAALSLAAGAHALRAVYLGDATHQASVSQASQVHTEVAATPNFQISVAAVAPATLPLTLTAGQAGTLNVTVIPVNNSSLTAPMFVTLSCSGLPQQSSCTFTPESVEILPTTPTSCATGAPAASCPPTSSMLVQTAAQTVTSSNHPAPVRNSSPIAWAFLLPGALGLGGLAWGARRRHWLFRLSLVALAGLVATMGTTACNPQYYYYNHGPGDPPATPTGSYTVTVTAQSANGVTAITNSTTVALTVN
jgi:hypothetical protein